MDGNAYLKNIIDKLSEQAEQVLKRRTYMYLSRDTPFSGNFEKLKTCINSQGFMPIWKITEQSTEYEISFFPSVSSGFFRF